MITWMDLKDIMLSEISKKEEDKYCMMFIIHRILKKTSKTTKLIDSEWWLPEAGGEIGEMGEGKSEGKYI